jgi:hypothetical protein
MLGIKGMDVPKNCRKCNFKYYDEGEDVLCCALEDGYISEDEADEKRLECCPLAETEERKKGHWEIKKASIHPYGNDVACSECGFTMGSSFGYKYCPMCGCKMESEG